MERTRTIDIQHETFHVVYSVNLYAFTVLIKPERLLELTMTCLW